MLVRCPRRCKDLILHDRHLCEKLLDRSLSTRKQTQKRTSSASAGKPKLGRNMKSAEKAQGLQGPHLLCPARLPSGRNGASFACPTGSAETSRISKRTSNWLRALRMSRTSLLPVLLPGGHGMPPLSFAQPFQRRTCRGPRRSSPARPQCDALAPGRGGRPAPEGSQGTSEPGSIQPRRRPSAQPPEASRFLVAVKSAVFSLPVLCIEPRWESPP